MNNFAAKLYVIVNEKNEAVKILQDRYRLKINVETTKQRKRLI